MGQSGDPTGRVPKNIETQSFPGRVKILLGSYPNVAHLSKCPTIRLDTQNRNSNLLL